MGLLSKLRSRDEQDADTSDEEEAPPPYVYGEGQAIHASDSKASLASSASKEDDVNDATEELNPHAVYLDCRKLDKGGTSIVTHDTGKVVYTLVKEKRFTRGIVHMYKGDVPNDADQRAASPALAYATVKMSSILLREDEDQVEPVKYKNKEFIRAGKWYGMPNRFTVNGTEYRIRQITKSWTGKLTLIVADDPAKAALCMFRPKSMFGDLRFVIEILPEAVSSASSPKPNALLDDGKPTKLLDMALVAELMVRRYIQQANAAVVS